MKVSVAMRVADPEFWPVGGIPLVPTEALMRHARGLSN
jgi:hypothetical protein